MITAGEDAGFVADDDHAVGGPALDEPAARARLRGVLHQLGFLIVAALGPILFVRDGRRWPVAVYFVALATMLGLSAAYHRGRWTARTSGWLRRADHAAIFVMIAGTYTPLCALALPADDGRWFLVVGCTGAALGVLRAVAWPDSPRWVVGTLGIVLGWTLALAIPALLRAGGPPLLVLLSAGGACHTLGTIIYTVRWPDPWPRTFGYHEVFHALTLVGFSLHVVAILSLTGR